MNNIQKDPIQPGQAPMPQRDNTALKVVVIVLIVIFGFPIILVTAVIFLVFNNFDKITDWLDDHADEWNSGSAISSDIEKSASRFYEAGLGKNVKVSSDDCWNIKTLFGTNNSSARFLNDVCRGDEVQIGAREHDGSKSIYFMNSDACLEVVFSKDFSKNYSYNYNSFDSTCNAEMKTIKFQDYDDEDDDEEEPLENADESLSKFQQES